MPGMTALPPPESGEEMRLDEAGEDLVRAGKEVLLDLHLVAACRDTDLYVLSLRARVVLDDAEGADNLAAKHAFQLLPRVQPVRAGGVEERDLFPRHAGRPQLVEDGRDDLTVGSRPGDVAEYNCHGIRGTDGPAQSRTANGRPQGCKHGIHRVG